MAPTAGRRMTHPQPQRGPLLSSPLLLFHPSPPQHRETPPPSVSRSTASHDSRTGLARCPSRTLGRPTPLPHHSIAHHRLCPPRSTPHHQGHPLGGRVRRDTPGSAAIGHPRREQSGIAVHRLAGCVRRAGLQADGRRGHIVGDHGGDEGALRAAYARRGHDKVRGALEECQGGLSNIFSRPMFVSCEPC